MDVSVAKDQRTAVTVNLDGKILAWDITTGEHTLVGEHGTRSDHISLSQDGAIAITGGMGNSAETSYRVWDVKNRTSIGKPVFPGDGWFDVAFACDDSGFFVAGERNVRWCQLKPGNGGKRWDEMSIEQPVSQSKGRRPIVASPTHPRRAYFVDAETSTVILRDFEHEKEVQRFRGITWPIAGPGLVVAASEKRIGAWAEGVQEMIIWNAETGDDLKFQRPPRHNSGSTVYVLVSYRPTENSGSFERSDSGAGMGYRSRFRRLRTADGALRGASHSVPLRRQSCVDLQRQRP